MEAVEKDLMATMSFYPRNMQRSGVHPLLPLLSTLGLEYNISMEGLAWQGRPGKADRAAHRSRARRAGRRFDLCSDFLDSVKTQACCRGRQADSNVQLEVGGRFLSTCEAILMLCCRFR